MKKEFFATEDGRCEYITWVPGLARSRLRKLFIFIPQVK